VAWRIDTNRTYQVSSLGSGGRRKSLITPGSLTQGREKNVSQIRPLVVLVLREKKSVPSQGGNRTHRHARRPKDARSEFVNGSAHPYVIPQAVAVSNTGGDHEVSRKWAAIAKSR